jgi:hypothetical protein
MARHKLLIGQALSFPSDRFRIRFIWLERRLIKVGANRCDQLGDGVPMTRSHIGKSLARFLRRFRNTPVEGWR